MPVRRPKSYSSGGWHAQRAFRNVQAGNRVLMFRHCLLLLLLFPLLLSAQTLERSFGLELTPQSSQRRISGTNNVTFAQLEEIDSLEFGTFGFGIGAIYESRVDRIGFSTGVRYTNVGYGTLEQPQPGAPGASYSDRVTAHYLSVPLELNFYQDVTEQDRVLFMLGAGLQYHLGTRTERTTFAGGEETASGRLEEDLSYRPLLASFTTGIGYDRKLSSDWAIRFQPTFQFFLNGNLRPEEGTRANRNFYQVGLRVVVRRLFI